jgi:uncharacterized protein (UPF0212 family)
MIRMRMDFRYYDVAILKKKECPSCAMNIEAGSRECPICGYAFMEATPWIKYMAIFLLIVFLLSYFIF